jgi:outer membrane protein assembly factor BamE (lipoprotein component of BamABCDE complex)
MALSTGSGGNMTIIGASMRISMKILTTLLLAVTLASCASYDGRGLRPGASTEAQLRQVMGEPAMEFTNPDGSRELAYPRGPLGHQTFMAHVSRDGIVQAIDPVLSDDVFNAIRPGMTQEEVLRLIGPPRETMSFARSATVAWDYKYQDTWGYPAIFSVIFDRNGRVVSKTTQRLERDRFF